MSEISIPEGAQRVPGQSANASKQQQAFQAAQEKTHWEQVGKAAESFNRYLHQYSSDYNLSQEEMAQALYLEVLNWKEFWPAAQGGPAKFDELSKDVWNWFQANKGA